VNNVPQNNAQGFREIIESSVSVIFLVQEIDVQHE